MIKLFLLPGFLGRPSDFNDFQIDLVGRGVGINFEVFDWLTAGEDILSSPLDQVGEKIFTQLEERSKGADEVVVLGYSLGGRLTLSLRDVVLRKGLDWKFIFVSTNPGLTTTDEREQRRKADAKWFVRFAEDPWLKLMDDWNAQPVFKDSKVEPVRHESHYERADLGRILSLWSLAEQDDYRKSLAAYPKNFHWITGLLDTKFTALAADIPNRQAIPGASHRVHLDTPVKLAESVLNFLLKG